jgi:hypothetical protein
MHLVVEQRTMIWSGRLEQVDEMPQRRSHLGNLRLHAPARVERQGDAQRAPLGAEE